MRKMRRRNKVPILFCILLTAAMLFSAGCLSFNTKPRGLEPAAYDMKGRGYELIGESEGQSSSFKLFWFFPVTPGYDYKEAVDEAIAVKGGDNLIEIEYYFERQWWIVGTIEILSVRGKAVKYQD